MQNLKLQIKVKKLFLKSWPVLVIFLLVTIFSFPYWGKGLAPFPSTYLVTWFPPWNAYFGMPVKNAAMPDVISQIYPWRRLTIGSLKSGQWPFWNPYNFAGNPHLANFQSAVFHPLNFLFWLLPFLDAWSLMILLQPFLATLFTYLFCRSLKISQEGSLLASIAFGFCGFLTVWLAYGTLGYALLFLPLALYAIEKDKKLLLSFSLAFSLFSGHFQTSVYVLAMALVYLFWRKRWRLLTFWIFGILLAFPQLLPALEFYQQSVRRKLFSLSEVIPFCYLITILAPDFFGNPVTRNDWLGHYAEWAGFFGVIPFLLAVYSLIRKRNREIKFFALVGMISLGFATPTPLLDLLMKLKIPVLSTSAASRIIALFSFSGAVLAGFGLNQLKKDWQEKKLKPLFLLLLGFFFFFLSVWGVLLVGKPFEADKLLVAKRNLILPTGMFLAFAGLIIGASFLRYFFKKERLITDHLSLITLWVILLLTTFDLLRFAKKWMPFDPREYVYPQMEVIKFLQKKTKGVDRIFGNFGTETQTYFHLPAVEGYDPLYIKRYGELISTAGDGKIGELSRSTVYLNKNGRYTPKILNLLGVRYIFHTISDDRQIWAFPFWKYPNQFELIYQDEKHEVYENQSACPRAFLVYNYQVEKEGQKIIDKMLADEFAVCQAIVLEEEPDLTNKQCSKRARGENRVKIIDYTPNKVAMKTFSSCSALLFLSDNYYPGWKAFVDQKETKIYRADYSFRAIIVPQGEHQVVFSYQPPSFFWGKRISLVTLLLLFVRFLVRSKIKANPITGSCIGFHSGIETGRRSGKRDEQR